MQCIISVFGRLNTTQAHFWPTRNAKTIQRCYRLCSSQANGGSHQKEWTLSERIKNVDINFMDSSQTVFRGKTKKELRRALTVFWLCSSKFLVKYNQQV